MMSRKTTFTPRRCASSCSPAKTVTVVASTEAQVNLNGRDAFAERQAYEQDVLDQARTVFACRRFAEPLPQLALAADQFIVARPTPWTKRRPFHHRRISLVQRLGPRYDDRPARSDPEHRTTGNSPPRSCAPSPSMSTRACCPTASRTKARRRNTTPWTPRLWFFEAVRQTIALTNDKALLAELFPVLADIIDWHQEGHALPHQSRSGGWAALCGRRRGAAYLDGCQSGRLGRYAAHG